MSQFKKKTWCEWLWDFWCIISIIGIWPRFIEPRLLVINRFSLPIPRLPVELNGVKILQLSDLHWSGHFSSALLKKITKKVNQLKPDVIVFTGDMLCRSKLEKEKELRQFLCSLQASAGCFAVLGNHDYEQFVTVNENGDYDIEKSSMVSDIVRGFKRLIAPMRLTKQVTAEARSVDFHPILLQMLKQTPFTLLNNLSHLVKVRKSYLNICGIEEYTTGRLDAKKAFDHYNSHYPGIILVHNPDAIPQLSSYSGELILSGHTHGGQVNLPGLWKKFTCLEHQQFKRGLKKVGSKWVYINRGISSVMKFRWFSIPELSLFTLYSQSI